MPLVDIGTAHRTPEGEPVPDRALAYACETCGQNRAQYVVADLEAADTSLFCPACIVITFAKVASEIGAA